ncbi:MAG TPA: DUF5684 domain-containing protein [Vicinamibacterales bacterium]|jgi:hypothetical protein|nr:DUF5684 domain-containing protein [Vicinamibacterales bacterium]
MTNLLAMMLSLSQDGSAAGVGGKGIVYLLVAVVTIPAVWKTFTKAGEPGWAAIVPIYNLIVLLKIAGKPAWWFLLLLVPLVNFVVLIIVLLSLARNFGKGGGFAMGLLFLPPIFYPILAWGDAAYQPQPA